MSTSDTGARPKYLELFEKFEAPFSDGFDDAIFRGNFAEELKTASRLWFRTGYGQGIAAYLNFFLLKDFIVTHDEARPSRFAAFKPMAESFYQIDLFVRDITDSGKEPTGGISNPKVRKQLADIMARNILRLAEMIGVSSKRENIMSLLPEQTRTVFEPIYPRVRPGFLRRIFLHVTGRLLIKQAVGEPREAVPFEG